MFRFITDREIYEIVIADIIPKAKEFVWIGTADIKDLYLVKEGKSKPLLGLLSELIKKGVEIRLIHAKEPGPAFRTDFDKYPALAKSLERMLCPRVHFKIVIVDGVFAYTGSANLTGAGMGAKSSSRRNFENGFITDETELVEKISEQFDNVWMGKFCKICERKEFCTDCPLV